MSIANNLRELRQELGLSQKQLAEQLDISQSAIARWELSKTEPTASALVIIANFFNITVGQLVGTEEY